MNKRRLTKSLPLNKRAKSDVSNIHISDFYFDLRLMIVKYALDDMTSFDQTWRDMRLVCKMWKEWVTLDKLIPFRNNDLNLHVFFLTVRCNEQTWYMTISSKLGIDPTIEDFRVIREAIQYDSDRIFQAVLPYVNWKDKKLVIMAAEMGAKKVLMLMIQTRQTLFMDKINILRILAKKDRYEIMNDIIRYCREHSVDLYHQVETLLKDNILLDYACERGYTKLMDLILSLETSPGLLKMSLNAAAINGYVKTVRHLLPKTSCGPQFISAIISDSASRGHTNVVQLLIAYSRSREMNLDLEEALYRACIKNRLETVKMLLREEPKLNRTGDILLSEVAKSGRWKILQELIDFSDLNIVNFVIQNAAERQQWKLIKKILVRVQSYLHDVDVHTILSCACQENDIDLEFIRELLDQYHADPNTDSNCLEAAALNHRNDIVTLIAQHPKISHESIMRAIQNLITLRSLYRDTLDILLSIVPVTKESISWMIDAAPCSSYNPIVLELLRRVWEDDDRVPFHWRFFYSMNYMTDESQCLYPECMFDVPPIILHLRRCKMVCFDSELCDCRFAFFSDGRTEYSIQTILRMILSDIEKEPPDFMDTKLFESVKRFIRKLTGSYLLSEK